MNNNDERDHAEEAHNARLMREEEKQPATAHNNWSDYTALWQVRHRNPESPYTRTAWDYIESRLQGCDQALANARIDDIEPDES